MTTKRLVVVAILLGLFLIWTLKPPSIQAERILLPPSLMHPLGTDDLGRDVLQLTLVAARYTLSRSLIILTIAFGLGFPLGFVSGLKIRGGLDQLVVFVAEALRSIPGLLTVIMILNFGGGIVAAMSAFFWISIWRLTRIVVSEAVTERYFEAAIALGHSLLSALYAHVLPNTLPRLIPVLVASFAEVLSAIAAVEFLGIGVPVDEPSLGRVLASALRLGPRAIWVWVPTLLALQVGILLLYLTVSTFLHPGKRSAFSRPL
jgi:peptide/nickel transport system permease protein